MLAFAGTVDYEEFVRFIENDGPVAAPQPPPVPVDAMPQQATREVGMAGQGSAGQRSAGQGGKDGAAGYGAVVGVAMGGARAGTAGANRAAMPNPENVLMYQRVISNEAVEQIRAQLQEQSRLHGASGGPGTCGSRVTCATPPPSRLPWSPPPIF